MSRPRKEHRLKPLTENQRALLRRIVSVRRYEYEDTGPTDGKGGFSERRTLDTLTRRGLITDDGVYAYATDEGRAQVIAVRPTRGPKHARRLAVATNEPLVCELAEIIDASGITHRDLVARAGIGTNTMHQWLREGRAPGLPNFLAVLGVLGKRLAIVDMEPRT